MAAKTINVRFEPAPAAEAVPITEIEGESFLETMWRSYFHEAVEIMDHKQACEYADLMTRNNN